MCAVLRSSCNGMISRRLYDVNASYRTRLRIPSADSIAYAIAGCTVELWYELRQLSHPVGLEI